MSSICRPFEDKEPQPGNVNRKNKRLNIIVGESEKDLVMEAYNSRIGSGWDAVLQQVKQNIERLPLSSRIVDYYLEGERNNTIKRLKCIVRERMKEEANAATSSKDDDATRPSKIALDRQIVYVRKRTPEQRRRDKLDQFRDESEKEEELQNKPPKKKTVREATLQAQTAPKKCAPRPWPIWQKCRTL
jgi:hypothetical protein